MSHMGPSQWQHEDIVKFLFSVLALYFLKVLLHVGFLCHIYTFSFSLKNNVELLSCAYSSAIHVSARALPLFEGGEVNWKV